MIAAERLERISEPAWAVITAEEVARQVRVPVEADQGQFEFLAEVATEAGERWTRRQFATASYRVRFASFADVLELPRPPLQQVDLFTYQDTDDATQAVSSTLYDVQADRLVGEIRKKPLATWPSVSGSEEFPIVCEYTAGWASPELVPSTIRLALLGLAAHFWENPEAVAVMRRIDGVVEIPLHSRELLNSWKIPDM